MVDGLFIRSLLCSFFFKVFPEIIQDGRLFIAEPPLYKVESKVDPFVINKEDYISRYTDKVIKDYQIEIDDKKLSKTELADESQHARPPCPSPNHGIHSDSHLSRQ